MLMVRKHNNAPAVCFARGPREDVVAIAARFGTRVQRAMSSARGWWLVEAESAADAREVIAACEEAAKAVREAGGVSYDPTSTRWAFGRVLAHGGRK